MALIDVDDIPPAPRHQCLNVVCGCNDLVSAGTCSEWCAANTIELIDVERGRATMDAPCDCGHALCLENRSVRGTPERGMS
ncbi:MAG TPA: hypothetical protein VGN14_07655 [Candidatus Elarobacter sp.]|jgi:hypothetical protein